jgi:hypothetical protein
MSRHASLVHKVINIGVGIGAGLAAGALCGATAGFGCLAIAGAGIGGVFGTAAHIGAAHLMHERITPWKAAKWALGSTLSAGVWGALKRPLGLGGMQLGRFAARHGLRETTRFVRSGVRILFSRRHWFF